MLPFNQNFCQKNKKSTGQTLTIFISSYTRINITKWHCNSNRIKLIRFLSISNIIKDYYSDNKLLLGLFLVNAFVDLMLISKITKRNTLSKIKK